MIGLSVKAGPMACDDLRVPGLEVSELRYKQLINLDSVASNDALKELIVRLLFQLG